VVLGLPFCFYSTQKKKNTVTSHKTKFYRNHETPLTMETREIVKIITVRSFETSGRNYPSTWRNIPEHLLPHQYKKPACS